MSKKIILSILLLIFMPAIVTAATGWLHTDGSFIKDAEGNIVILRGVNMVIRLQNEQAKFVAAKAMGANVVRLMLFKQDIENPGPPVSGPGDQSGLAAIDRAVGWARDVGLMVIFDQQIWSLNVAPAPPEFFTDPTLQESWLAMWRTLIDRYKDDPTVIGVDLMNEPWVAVAQSPSITDPQGIWETIVKRAVTELKPRNPNLLFVVAGWGQRSFPGFRDVTFLQQPNVVYTDHVYYAPTINEFHSWEAAYNSGDVVNGKALLETYAMNKWLYFTNRGIPVFIGEIGFDTSLPYWHEQMEDELNILDDDGLNYAIFVFGSAHWRLYYDIVDTSYNLTTVGLEYSNHLKSMEGNAPVPQPPSTPGDLNNDGDVDVADLSVVAVDFGKTSGFNNLKSDTNNDNIVDIYDVVYVASRFT